ncbi:MAG: gliding motility-associated C-terminal domain-containing protein [Bacteroidota bacterium]
MLLSHRFMLCVFCLFLCFGGSLVAQNEALIWHFGDSVAVSFASGSPERIAPSSMTSPEGCASICDANGQLLYYTNGGGRISDQSGGQNPGMIWDRNGDLLYDMMGTEGGGFSARQSSIFIPDPAAPSNYYLFTMEEEEFDIGGSVPGQPEGRGLSYFYLDQSLNGGLGGVSLADQRVFTPSFEGLAATPNVNGEGYWIIINGAEENELVVVPLTTAGVGLPQVFPFTQNLGGSIKISPDGQWIAVAGNLIAFDPTNGQPGAVVAELEEVNFLTSSFTPDSRYYYSAKGNFVLGRTIVRYDLSASPIGDSEELIGILSETGISGQMQIGPNGNLYFLDTDLAADDFQLAEIECPSADLPTITPDLVDLNDTDELFFGLPNYVDAIFRDLGTEDTTFLEPSSREICRGESISPRLPGLAYQWSTGDTSFSIQPRNSATYVVTITGACTVTIDSQFVSVDRIPDANIFRTLAAEPFCIGEEVDMTVYSTPLPDSVIWSTGSREDTITTISTPGDTLSVVAYYACGDTTFSFGYPDTNVTVSAEIFYDIEEPLCPGDSINIEILEPNGFFMDVVWFDGTTGPLLRIPSVDSSLTYSATVTGDCDTVFQVFPVLDFSNCPVECMAIAPDLISPNNDGRNDRFRLFTNCELDDYQMLIYNRWGQEVYSSTNPLDNGWDGTRNGEDQPFGTYIYMLRYRFPDREEIEKIDGQFSLIR